MTRHRLLIVVVGLGLASCSPTEPNPTGTWSLYRSSIDEVEAIRLASFDTEHGSDHNRENCEIAAGLLQAQPGVTVRYWCEPGDLGE